MIKLCIFDMGGVVVRNFDVSPVLAEALGLENIKGFADFGPAFNGAMRLYSRGEINEEEFWRIYSEKTGVKADLSHGSLFAKDFRPTIDEPTREILDSLRVHGMRIVAGTNTIDVHYDIHVRLGQYEIFDAAYASNIIGIDKPDPEFFLYIAEKEGVMPEECFFTDDLKENVDAALGVGMKAFVYKDASTLLTHLRSVGIAI